MSYLFVVLLSCAAAFTLVAAASPDASAGTGSSHAPSSCHGSAERASGCDVPPTPAPRSDAGIPTPPSIPPMLTQTMHTLDAAERSNAGPWRPDASRARENPNERHFEPAADGGRDLSAAHDTPTGAHLVLTHTRVPERFAGRGVGSALARGVFEALRMSGRQAALRYPFLAAHRSLHPEFADVVHAFKPNGGNT